MAKILVIGAGVVGLTTAINIQKSITGSHVTVMADRFMTETTSDGAAGIYRPTYEKHPKSDRQRLRKWADDSWQYYDSVIKSEHAKEAGISMISGYSFFNENRSLPLYHDIVYNFRHVSAAEKEQLGFGHYNHAWYFTTVITECRHFLPWLMHKFTKSGGRIINKHIETLSDVCDDDYDIIVNCTGWGSKALLRDKSMVAIRGQMLRIEAPWVKHFLYTDDNLYIIPGMDNVILGGLRQWNDERTTSDPRERREMWHRACQTLPSLKHSTVQSEWIGLRPHRDQIRLEKEVIGHNGKTLRIVHNYGHGSNGVCLSWGTAMEAAQLVKQMLTQAKL